jgi:hypothetical protein
VIAGDDFDQRRFTCTVVTEQTDDLIGPQVKIDIFQGVDFTEQFRYITQL